MVGDGACAAISAALGSQKKERSTLLLKAALWMTGLGAVTITLIYAVFPNWLLGVFGGHVNERTWQFSREYLFWINTGMILCIVGQAPCALLSSIFAIDQLTFSTASFRERESVLCERTALES